MTGSAWLLVTALCLAPESTQPAEPVADEVAEGQDPAAVPSTEVEPGEGEPGEGEPGHSGSEVEPGTAAVEAEPSPVELEPQPEPEPIELRDQEAPADVIEQPTAAPAAKAQPRRRGPQPPVYGPILVTGGIGASARSVGLGVGVTGFPIPYLGLGIGVDDTIFFGDGVFNEFAATPLVWVIPLPYRSFTPFVRGGFGVDVFSHGLGVYGIWKAAGGIILRLGKTQRVAIRAGLEVIGRVSDDRFSQNFVCGLVDDPCSLRLRPELGFGLRFGGPR